MTIALILGGLALMAWGLFESFAGGMSDAPGLGDDYVRRGCIIVVLGLALLIGGIAKAVL